MSIAQQLQNEKKTTLRPQTSRTNALLPGVVVLFAFLASSFALSESEFWFHLANGHRLVQGYHSFGTVSSMPPVTPASGINPSWLFDGVLYLLYQVVDGPGVIVLKAVLMAALAGLLLRLRRRDGGNAWPVICTLLALLVLSPHLLVQPAVLSYLFLALTLWLLWPPHNPGGGKHLWFLPLLVAIWSNVDSGFLLGLLLIGLFWLGGSLTSFSPRAEAKAESRTPVWLPFTCLAASLLNPHYWHAWTLPPEFTPGVIAADGFQRMLDSPWRWHGKDGPFLGEASYFTLIGLGLLSFVLNRRHLPGWRLTVWIGFALLSAWRLGLTPHFAVVAGPITALNMQDYLASRDDPATGRRRVDWPLLARFLLLVLGLGLVFVAGAGQLRGIHGERRPICWRMQPDSSLEQLALTMRKWREEGRLQSRDRILAFDPHIAHYCAWICPEAELLCPPAFSSRETAAAFEEARRELRCPLEDADRCAGLLREWNVAYAAVENTDALDELIARPRQWLLAEIDGRVAIFAWGSAGVTADARKALDVYSLAFRPEEKNDKLGPAPAQGPERGPAVPSFWTSLRPVPVRTWESEAATTYLRYFQEAALPRYQRRWAESWSAFAASLAAVPSPATPPPATVAAFLVRLQNPPSFLGDIDRDLPALPLLAVRAARRALAANPDDANAYLRLGQAYLALWEKTGELPLSGGNTLLLDLRHIQIVTALEQAVLCDPDNIAAHRLLGRIYLQRRYLDAALDHVRAELRLTQRNGPRRGEKPETYRGRLGDLERQVGELQRVVEANQQRFDASNPEGNADPAARAKAALTLGLPRRALEDILTPVPPVLLQSGGLQLEMQLMLRLGRAEQLRGPLLDPQWEHDQANLSWLELPVPPVPGYPRSYRLPAYSWFRFCWAAAVGNYDLAEKQVNDLLKQLNDRRQQQLQALRRSLTLALTSELGFFSDGQLLMLRPAAHDARVVAMSSFVPVLAFLGDQADVSVLDGLLALERGSPQLAEQSFERARQINQADGDIREHFATQTLAEAYERRLRSAAPKH